MSLSLLLPAISEAQNNQRPNTGQRRPAAGAPNALEGHRGRQEDPQTNRNGKDLRDRKIRATAGESAGPASKATCRQSTITAAAAFRWEADPGPPLWPPIAATGQSILASRPILQPENGSCMEYRSCILCGFATCGCVNLARGAPVGAIGGLLGTP